ncbi:hypothetical protein AWB85_21770 [Mycobacteroides immunogenum]|uniref:Transcriptional regulator WhiB n=1 Tax=Mycobacteroides immunogenum TaxID=83262 RepID=A0A179VE50_9MYCO|nr:hypothetical protein AWB85_21770 [Mycobacteroides immunogenum]
MIDNTWKNRAACSGHDPALWFGTGERGPTDEQTRQAKAICAQCPVRQLCLANAEPSGTWGGLTEQERRTLRRKRRAA